MSKLDSLIGLIKRYDMTGEPDLEDKIDKLKSEIESAFKLPELIKKKIEEVDTYDHLYWLDDREDVLKEKLIESKLLQSLVEESEK